MKMKEHILTALREQFNHWAELFVNISEEQINAPLLPSDWCMKNVITHLWAWQQISVARMEAARHDHEPEFPKWVAELQADWEGNANQTNAWIYDTYRGQPWPNVNQNWLEGNPLVFVLLASYEHHQEHLEKLVAWLQENDMG